VGKLPNLAQVFSKDYMNDFLIRTNGLSNCQHCKIAKFLNGGGDSGDQIRR